MATYVGLDLGTSVVKGAVFDEQGTMLRTAARPARLELAGDRAEQDADAIHALAEEVLRELDARPALVGLTGQGDGLWLLDGAGRPVRRAISWLDGRAAALLAQWSSSGVVEQVFRRTGAAMFPGCAAPLLRWLDDHEPDVLDAAATAGYCKDMVFQRLTGVRATDVSDASLPFLDPWTRRYDPAAIEACGLTHRADVLAPVHDPGAVAEVRGPDVLPAGTPLTAGPYDLAACALGAGVTEPGDGLLIIGTTLACEVVSDAVDVSGEPAGLHISLATPGRWLRAMPAMVGTAALDWMLATTGLRHDQVDGLLGESPVGANGVRMLPYLAPSGERAPFVEPAARGELTGVSLATSRADLVRATCEAIAFAARHCLEASGLTGRLTVCGGGSRSPGWMQLFADVLGRPVHAAPEEAGARGAVLSAASRFGADLPLDSWSAAISGYHPDPAAAAFYAEEFAGYREWVGRARSTWSARRGLAS